MSFTVTTTTGQPYAHPSNCSGCPVCREEFAGLLTMPASEHAAWLRRRNNEHPHYHRFASGPDDPPTLESVFENHFQRSGPPAPSASEVLLPSDTGGYADPPPSLADVINDQIKKGVRES